MDSEATLKTIQNRSARITVMTRQYDMIISTHLSTLQEVWKVNYRRVLARRSGETEADI